MSDIQHAHLYGMREAKYDWLLNHDVNSIDSNWKKIEPQKPFHLFIPQNNDSLAEFLRYWKITEVMPINSVGIVTGQDANTIAFSYEEVEKLAKLAENIEFDSVEQYAEKVKILKESYFGPNAKNLPTTSDETTETNSKPTGSDPLMENYVKTISSQLKLTNPRKN